MHPHLAEKRQAHDRHFINVSGPPRKRQRRIIQPVTDAAREAAQKQWEEEAGARAEALAQIQCDEEAQRKANIDDHILATKNSGSSLQLEKKGFGAEDFTRTSHKTLGGPGSVTEGFRTFK
ncbi:hypothetical protein B0H14DRAFT_3881321 [Mycena olivaceomarginata]|nr:hypothetical protein B0H14DRAFT_3881321 [Mycena olivaceomarginata]